MKLYSAALLSIPFVIACSNESKPVVKTHSFSYRGEYYPSFLPFCTITIVAQGATKRVKLRAYKDHGATQPIVLLDSATLSPADLTFFFTKLDSVPVLKMVSKEQAGTDGITVVNTVSQDSTTNKFTFWSFRKDSAPQEHKLVEAVLGLSRRKFTASKEQEYFESLEQYFDFGLPCKVTNTDPFEVRMYGSLSSNEEQDLNKFVRTLPLDKPILIDVTNFQGMGTMFFPLFQRLLAQNTRIGWVASPWSRKQLQEMGVPIDRITLTTADGRALIQRLSSATN